MSFEICSFGTDDAAAKDVDQLIFVDGFWEVCFPVHNLSYEIGICGADLDSIGRYG